jgi:queuosine precursor transporter
MDIHMHQQYKCLTPIAMFYMTIKLVTILLIYKIVNIGPITTTAATIIIPLWFYTGDVIAEVYGYNTSKQIIWATLICQFIFACLCASLINLPSPANWAYQGAYDHVLGNLPRVVTASFIAIVCGAFVNAYTVSKWKVLLKGRLFWLRSLGSSIIGEAVFVIIALSIEFIGVTPWKTLLQLMLISFIIKVAISPILVIPSSILAALIKKIEKIDVYDYDLEFNPFKIKFPKISNDTILNPIEGK